MTRARRRPRRPCARRLHCSSRSCARCESHTMGTSRRRPCARDWIRSCQQIQPPNRPERSLRCVSRSTVSQEERPRVASAPSVSGGYQSTSRRCMVVSKNNSWHRRTAISRRPRPCAVRSQRPAEISARRSRDGMRCTRVWCRKQTQWSRQLEGGPYRPRQHSHHRRADTTELGEGSQPDEKADAGR